MRKWLGIIGLAIVALVVAGCSSISSGIITNKVYNPGYWYTTTTCQLIGKTTICTPHTNYMPETYRFDITDSGKNGFVYVNGAAYNEYEVGDYYG